MRWIVGDIHGMLQALEALLERVRAADRSPRLIFVGDYVNRGPDSRKVIDLLLSLEHARFLRGNHDDVFDQLLNGQSYTGADGEMQRLSAFQWFMRHGLDATLLSYGAAESEIESVARRPTMERLNRLLDRVPPEHRAFVRGLAPVYEQDDLFVAHAMWDPDEPDAQMGVKLRGEAMRQKLIWGRFTREELARKKAWARRGYFGHTPTHNYQPGQALPVIGAKIVLLDTAVALLNSGRLTAYCADTHTFIQVDRRGHAPHT